MREELIKNASCWGIELLPAQADKLERHFHMLVERNAHMNLTAITDADEAVSRHYMDSLAPLSDPETAKTIRKNGSKLIDIGSGAGFPGIPLAAAVPELEATLLDSLKKRAVFLLEAAAELELSNIRVVDGRSEDAAKDPAHREQYDVAVSRAVADLSVLSEYCLPFVKPGGIFAAYKGADAGEEAQRAENAIELLGGALEKTILYTLPGTDISHTLFIIKKTGVTPEKYPRRAGIPSKRPL